MSIHDIKAIARTMQEVIEQFDGVVSYQKTLNLISKYYGFDSYYAAECYAKEHDINLNDNKVKSLHKNRV